MLWHSNTSPLQQCVWYVGQGLKDKVLKGPSSAGRQVSFHARLARSMMQVVAFIHHVCISLNAVLDVRDVGLSVRNRP